MKASSAPCGSWWETCCTVLSVWMWFVCEFLWRTIHVHLVPTWHGTTQVLSENESDLGLCDVLFLAINFDLRCPLESLCGHDSSFCWEYTVGGYRPRTDLYLQQKSHRLCSIRVIMHAKQIYCTTMMHRQQTNKYLDTQTARQTDSGRGRGRVKRGKKLSNSARKRKPEGKRRNKRVGWVRRAGGGKKDEEWLEPKWQPLRPLSPVILVYPSLCSVIPHLSIPCPHPSLSLNLSILLLSSRPAQTGVKSSGASKAAVWRLHVMWEPQQPCLQTSQTAAATIDPRPASSG